MAAETRMFGAEHALRCGAGDAGDRRREQICSTVWSVGSTASKAAVMLMSASAGTTMRSAPSRLKPTAMLAPMLRSMHARRQRRLHN